MIDYEKIRSELLDFLDCLSDDELLEELKKCGLEIEQGEENV